MGTAHRVSVRPESVRVTTSDVTRQKASAISHESAAAAARYQI
jgi:hypothetical protein